MLRSRLLRSVALRTIASASSSSSSSTSSFLPSVEVIWLGRDVSYADGLAAQSDHLRHSLQRLQDGALPEQRLLLLEHRPVYTLGLRSEAYSPEEEARLRSFGAEVVRADRGGLVTFHGPGQLVAYPLLDLGQLARPGAIRWYVQRLEAWIASFCAQEFGLVAGPMDGCTGVWLRKASPEELDRKIAAIGIRVRQRRLTSHGIALNACVDLDWFSRIVPCGIRGKGVTSLSAEIRRRVETEQILRPFLAAFASTFGVRLRLPDSLDASLPLP